MKHSLLPNLNNEGWVVVPNLPINPGKPRREAWAKVTAAGLKGKHPYPGKMKAEAQAFADACTKASGVEFVICECIY